MTRHQLCGHSPPDYYINYGYKYCVLFTDELRPKLSAAGQAWLDRTRKLLQVYMEEGLQDKPELELDNENFRLFAFKTHPDAYWDAGFHSIPIGDKIEVVCTPNMKEWLNGDTWKQALEMTIRELEAYWSDISDAIKQKIAKAINRAAKEIRQAIESRVKQFINDAIDKIIRPLPEF